MQISPVNILLLSKTSSRHLQDMSSRRLEDMSSKSLQRNNFLSSKTSSRRLARCLQDVFAKRLQDVFKTSWKTKICYAEDVLKTSKCLLGSSHLRCSIKKGVSRNVTKFTGKHQCQRFFFNKNTSGQLLLKRKKRANKSKFSPH